MLNYSNRQLKKLKIPVFKASEAMEKIIDQAMEEYRLGKTKEWKFEKFTKKSKNKPRR